MFFQPDLWRFGLTSTATTKTYCSSAIHLFTIVLFKKQTLYKMRDNEVKVAGN